MKEGKYCKNCHPNGHELTERHNKEPHNKNYKPYFGICDECKLLTDYWYWAGDNESELQARST